MSVKLAIELGDVQKTLLLPLWGRAVETRKARPLLVDPAAAHIIDRVAYDFSAMAQRLSAVTQAAWIMRSVIVDEVVAAFLARSPAGVIVNVGCGLDTTFERVDNGRLTWYDLDLPDVIALRAKFIPQTERRKFIAASFLDEGWLNEIQAQDVLFIAAGVFYYFSEQEVKGFLIRLADLFPGSEIIFDVCSPYGVKVANRLVIESSGLDQRSYLQWGLARPQALLAWDPRFRLRRTFYYFGGRGRAWPLRTRLFGMLADALKVQYMLQLAL